MALVRVYCGLASKDAAATQPTSAGSWLTVAVVDDAGRLLDVCEISDDPAGYAELGALLSERAGGPAGVSVATDSDEHQVTLLLATAGRPLAIADEESLDDYAERFADDDSAEEIAYPLAERRAVGLARALQAGALAASTQAPPRDLVNLKPVLAAHAAVAAGRQSAAVALREVLRELYPAALRAYPDPADPIPLAILDALPEPGLLGPGTANRGRDAAVATELAEAGIADAQVINEAITALRLAIAETPRRTGIGRTLTAAVAETIRQSVAAVRACDAAVAALIGVLNDRPSATVPAQRSRAARRAQEEAATPPAAAQAAALRAVREGSGEQMRVPVPARRSRSSAVPSPAAAATTSTPPANQVPALPPAPPVVSTPPAVSAPPVISTPPAVSAPPAPPPPGITPMPPNWRPNPAATPVTPAAVLPPVATGPANDYGYGPDRATPVPAARPTLDSSAPGSRSTWPLATNGNDDAVERPRDNATPAADQSHFPSAPAFDRRPEAAETPKPAREGRVTPPWQADDLPAEPPALRLVEPAPIADRALRPERVDERPAERLSDRFASRLTDRSGERSPNGSSDRANGSAPRPDAPLRVVDDARPRREIPVSVAPPVPDSGDDGDLLIFKQTKSAWFVGQTSENAEITWDNPADQGWRAAEQAARPRTGEATGAGLPRRVPQANLVPGSPLPQERPLRIVRDPAAMAAHTTGYFRGSRRGEEVRGFAVGGRPGRDNATGWDFARESSGSWEMPADRDRNRDREYGYRPAAHR
ncbi:MAG TPA: transposase [Micromonosporaceae bacterium]